MPRRDGVASSIRNICQQRVSHDVTSRAVFDFLSALDCPRSLAIWILYREKEFQQLISLDFKVSHYSTFRDVKAAYLATSLLSKFEDFPLTVDKKGVAVAKFEQFELSCRRVNRSFRAYRNQNWKNSGLGPLLSAMAFKIDRILGDLNTQEIFDSCDWGPGASTGISSRVASSPHKFQYEIGITRRLYDLLCPDGSLTILRGYSSRWSTRLLEEGFPLFSSGNKVVTVPKNSKTDRVIAIEPGFNLWFQKGVGSVMKRRLRKRRIDLTDQSKNQDLARKSSIKGHLATIDFSSASDSISYELVKEIFPPMWFELLDRLRCERGKLDGKTYTWEKFSSMGNGYTFEVESLIFYALALACADELGESSSEISVYGDDVIIPVTLVELFHQYSERLGFSFNTEKSYADTPFRESCGAHWYDGFDLKPVYLKGKLNNVLAIYRFANAIRRASHRSWCYTACDEVFRTAFYRLVYSVPKVARLRIPEGYGDGGFISNFDEATPKRVSTKFPFYEGFFVKHVEERSILTSVEHDGLLLSRLKALKVEVDERSEEKRFAHSLALDLSKRSDGNHHSNRDRTRIVVTTSRAPMWYDLGPWM